MTEGQQGVKVYVYVAGPYTKGDVVVNTRRAILAADELRAKGYVPFVPHLSHLWHLLRPHESEFWYEYDIAGLLRCECVLRLPGESVGADHECAVAEECGIPVYHSIEELLNV